MKRTKREPRMLRVLDVCVMAMFAVLAACVAAKAQQQPPTVTRPSASSVQATPRRASSPYGSAAAAQTNMKVAAGTITGLVYWDMGSAQYKLSSPFQGLTVKGSTISKSGGQGLANTSNFTSMGPPTDLTAQGAPRYMLCSYSFHQMPVGEYLRVSAAVTANTFSAAVSVQTPPDFEIFGGNCNHTPPGTLSFILTGGEMVCGNNAYNINLKLYTSGSRSRGTLPVGSGPLLQNGSGTSTSGGALNLSGTGGGATTLPDGTLNLGKGSRGGTTSSGGTLQLSGQQQNATGSTLVPSPRAASTPAEENPGPGGTPSSKDPGPGGNPSLRDPGPGGIPLQQISGGFVPKMPPMASNPNRDAAPPADTSTKEQIKSQIK